MKTLRSAIAAVLLFVAAPAFAQWQTPNHSVPVGRGGGIQGFGNALPGVAGQPLVSTGSTSDPAFGTIANSGFAAGAANTVKGSLNGTSVADLPVPPCTPVSQAIQYTSGTGWSCGNILTLTGYDMPINMGLSASAVGGALTLNVTTASGAAPTTSAPVLVPFRSTTSTLGTVTWGTISSALSITIPSGASLGTTNGVPFRIWEFIDHNGGTPAIGVATCSSPTTIFACASWESTLKTSITINGSATAAGTLYATAGVNLDAVRIVGYCDFSSGLTTAGTWASSCTTLQPMGPGVKKPGDVVQGPIYVTNSQATTSSGATPTATHLTASISPTSTPNLVRVQAFGAVLNAANQYGSASIYRGTSTPIGSQAQTPNTASQINMNAPMYALDAPATVSSTAYTIYVWGTSNAVWNTTTDPCVMAIDEIMG